MPLLTGQIALTGTAQQLTSQKASPTAFAIKAPSTNAHEAFVGALGVTPTTGHALDPGETLEYGRGPSAFEGNYDLVPGDFYVVGTAGDVITWLAFL